MFHLIWIAIASYQKHTKHYSQHVEKGDAVSRLADVCCLNGAEQAMLNWELKIILERPYDLYDGWTVEIQSI